MSYAEQHDSLIDEGPTALILAARHGHAQVAEALLKGGADPDHATSDGRTALILAAEHGHLPIVEALLKAGADPNHATAEGGTALILAARNGHLPVVEALLKAGADPNHAAVSTETETYGTVEELNAFLDRLIERGAQLNAEWDELSAQIRRRPQG